MKDSTTKAEESSRLHTTFQAPSGSEPTLVVYYKSKVRGKPVFFFILIIMNR
jgi:hypothetical protein